MSTFLFAYRTPEDNVPGSPEVVNAWRAFFKGMESSVEDMGNPIFTRATVGQCDESTVLGGYSLISADSLEEALALAEQCPTIARGGGVEVGEVTRLNPDSVATTVSDVPATASTTS